MNPAALTNTTPMDATIILPIRKGSQRVVNKNIKPIGSFKYGLTEIKLRQLVLSGVFAEILIDTDLDEIEKILADIPSGAGKPAIRVEQRIPELAGSDATTDDLIRHLVAKVNTPYLVWSHVTSPFFNGASYMRFMQAFRDLPEDRDSLVAVDVLREFLWKDGQPLNYDRSKHRWPFTQSLDAIYLVNSAAFGIATDLAVKLGDRMGDTPQFFECRHMEGFDVDWPEQFDVVSLLVENHFPIL